MFIKINLLSPSIRFILHHYTRSSWWKNYISSWYRLSGCLPHLQWFMRVAVENVAWVYECECDCKYTCLVAWFGSSWLIDLEVPNVVVICISILTYISFFIYVCFPFFIFVLAWFCAITSMWCLVCVGMHMLRWCVYTRKKKIKNDFLRGKLSGSCDYRNYHRKLLVMVWTCA